MESEIIAAMAGERLIISADFRKAFIIWAQEIEMQTLTRPGRGLPWQSGAVSCFLGWLIW